MTAIRSSPHPGWKRHALLIALLCPFVLLASAPGRTIAGNEDQAVTERQENPPANPNRITEKQVKAYAGLAALAGIVIVGLALAGLIVLWAGRLRRQLRQPLPNASRPDRDFWFLKPPKPTVSSSTLPDSHQPPHDQPPTETPT